MNTKIAKELIAIAKQLVEASSDEPRPENKFFAWDPKSKLIHRGFSDKEEAQDYLHNGNVTHDGELKVISLEDLKRRGVNPMSRLSWREEY